MSSNNVSGGDNQQETALLRQKLEGSWIAGFVDGEGCFCISVHRNPFVRSTRGWQILPAFQVYQHRDHRDVLEDLLEFFGCGTIRPKGAKSQVETYSVTGLRALDRIVIPFFERYPLRVKDRDFAVFASIVRRMLRKEHLEPEGFEQIVRLAYGMNAHGKQRSRSLEDILAGSSETARQAPPLRREKIQSDLHGDMQSQAEMSWPPEQLPLIRE
jgi:LAGLIDADG endonuclease